MNTTTAGPSAALQTSTRHPATTTLPSSPGHRATDAAEASPGVFAPRTPSPLRSIVLAPALLAAATIMSRTAPTGGAPAWTSSTRLWAPADLDLTVVIPSYNPGPALTRTVSELCASLDKAHASFEVVVVSDGSTDGSEDGVEEIDPRVVLIRAPHNAGKGAALHRGFAAARGAHVAFVDADGDISADHVERYWHVARDGHHAIVYADKRHTRSQVSSSRFRKLVSLGFTTLVGSFFDLPIRDTQTGCKVVRRDVMASVLPLLRERGFAFDLELFVAAHTVGFGDFVGVPVAIGQRLAGSTVGARAVLRTLRESLCILGRLRLGHSYGSAPVVPLGVALQHADRFLQPTTDLVKAA